MGARSQDKEGKDFANIFNDLGLKITAQSNLKFGNYLDVTLNLTTGKFYPFRKPDNTPLYVNAKSSQPPFACYKAVKPTAISTRISTLSCDSEEFNKASKIHNEALKSSGYHDNLSYIPSKAWQNGKKKPAQGTLFGLIPL